MHDSVRRFGELMLNWGTVHGARILEVGSLDVNGSLRGWCVSQGCKEYVGTDMREGPNVDVVCAAEDLGDHSLGMFDVVVCTEMLEHAEAWRAALMGVKSSVRVGGHLLLTTRSEGFGRHDHPSDWWRFDWTHILMAMTGFYPVGLVEDPDAPGVLYFGRREPKGDIEIPDYVRPTPAPG